jgi:hypothetical protein
MDAEFAEPNSTANNVAAQLSTEGYPLRTPLGSFNGSFVAVFWIRPSVRSQSTGELPLCARVCHSAAWPSFQFRTSVPAEAVFFARELRDFNSRP